MQIFRSCKTAKYLWLKMKLFRINCLTANLKEIIFWVWVTPYILIQPLFWKPQLSYLRQGRRILRCVVRRPSSNSNGHIKFLSRPLYKIPNCLIFPCKWGLPSLNQLMVFHDLLLHCKAHLQSSKKDLKAENAFEDGLFQAEKLWSHLWPSSHAFLLAIKRGLIQNANF